MKSVSLSLHLIDITNYYPLVQYMVVKLVSTLFNTKVENHI